MQSDKSILLTFDVEDWFQVENLKKSIPFSSWPTCESRVEENTARLLDLLESAREKCGASSRPPLRATFFVLGWLADRKPHLVRQIAARGHEIASHGFYHRLCGDCSPAVLRNDLSDSKKLLEDVTGEAVYGYRAPSFSISPQVLELVAECGYTYDSSYNSFGGNSRYGHIDVVRNGCGIAGRVPPSLLELPVSNLEVAGRTIPMGGGGYFRLMPIWLFKRAVRTIINKEGAYLFYMHPWEIDPGQPRVKNLPLSYRFRHYVNLSSAASRLADLLGAFFAHRFLTCREYIDRVALSRTVGSHLDL